MSKRKIYALYIGINNYAYVSDLGGCINDANNIKQYIEEAALAQNMAIHSMQLHDGQATKANIVQYFLEHLASENITKHDTCLFYFAGHGIQEKAPTAFLQHEPDQKLETLACYDSKISRRGSFLADKELRYLIHQVYEKTKANIVTIFDCCHSGSNSRNPDTMSRLIEKKPTNKDIDEQSWRDFVRADGTVQDRRWQDFIFSDKITAEDVQNADALENVLPQGKHIHLAACENKQRAYEIYGKGVFTSNLVQLLKQTKGSINYRNLISALKLKIQGAYEQTPQLYAKGDKNLLFQPFLGGITQHQKHLANIVFNSSYDSWVIDMGAIHGIDKSNSKLKIALLNEQNEIVELAEIIAVMPDYTKISFSQNIEMDKEYMYQAYINGLIVSSLQIYCCGNEEKIKTFENDVANNEEINNYIKIIDKAETADYYVRASQNDYEILAAHNCLPLTDKIDFCEEEEEDDEILFDTFSNKENKMLFEDLKHIAQWHFAKNLENPNTRFPKELPLEIEFLAENEKGEYQKVEPQSDKLALKYAKGSENAEENVSNPPKLKLKLRIKNKSKIRSYYVALLYFSQDFSIYTDLLEGTTCELKPDTEIKALGGTPIPLKQMEYIAHYNWENETNYLKLIVSTHTFDVTTLGQEALPMPEVPFVEKRGRGLDRKKLKNANLPDWTTRTFELKMKNPSYKPPRRETENIC